MMVFSYYWMNSIHWCLGELRALGRNSTVKWSHLNDSQTWTSGLYENIQSLVEAINSAKIHWKLMPFHWELINRKQLLFGQLLSIDSHGRIIFKEKYDFHIRFCPFILLRDRNVYRIETRRRKTASELTRASFRWR